MGVTSATVTVATIEHRAAVKVTTTANTNVAAGARR